jgi:DNA repair protein SbcC/Rad50
MSYADATLDLSSMPVACLSGQNGAGKSALLDACTWVLWECARSSSDELMRLGEKEMWVDLTFIHEGERYRVRRARQKTSAKAGSKSSSKGTLDFQVFSLRQAALATAQVATAGGSEVESGASAMQDGSWRSLTSASMRETQKTINDLLRMDFDTFVNSAYLRQGRADEFTTRAPADRKQILSEILGLSYFDRLQEKAKERGRELKGQAEILSSHLTSVPELEAKLIETTVLFGQAQSNFEDQVKLLETLEIAAHQLRDEIASLSVAKEKLDSGAQQTSALQLDIINLRGQDDDLTKRLEIVNELLSQAQEIEAATAHCQDLKTKVEMLDKNLFVAQEHAAKKNEYQTELARMRSRLEVELDKAREHSQELEEKQEKLVRDTLDREKIEQSYTQYKQSIAAEGELAKRQETFTHLSNRANELLSKITEAKIKLEADRGQKESSLIEIEHILKSKSDVEEEKNTLEDQTQSLDRLEAEFEHVEDKGLKTKSKLEAKQHKIETLRAQKRDKLSKIEELHAHADSSVCPLCSAPIVDRAAVITRYGLENTAIDEEIIDLETSIAALDQERTELRKQYLEIRKKLDSRKTLDKQIGQFNEKLMAIERARENLGKIQQEAAKLEERLNHEDYAQVERESLIAIKAEIHKLDFDPLHYGNLQSQIRMQRHIEGRYQQLQKDLSELKKIEIDLPPLKDKTTMLADQLAAESYGREQRQLLAEIQNTINSLQYDRVEHAQLKQDLSQLMPSTDRFRDLQKAAIDKPSLQESLAACQKMLLDKHNQLAQFEQEREHLNRNLANLPEIRRRLEEQAPFLAEKRLSKDECSKHLAVLESETKRLTSELDELAAQRATLDSLRRQIDDYSFLAEAFGKKGIQAVIIENSIPEIESEANRILSRLTENKMHIALVTQHKTKSGTTVETLDLLIGDDIGTRSYELFSGGEAFKVNFAVRVALARLLARRAGAKLETLIIDEGFGSQDDASRERLVRAINSIQGEFARILVITHMADIREMFPQQILVSKVNGLSQLQMMY